MAKEIADYIEEISKLKVSISKLETTNANLKEERDERKKEIETLTQANTKLTETNTELTGKVNEVAKAEKALAHSKLVKETFKGKEKFADMIISMAELGDEFDPENLTEEQKTKIEKVLEQNPEFKEDISNLGGKPHIEPFSNDPVGGVEEDQSNFSNQ